MIILVGNEGRLPFKEARKFARTLGFQNREAWREYYKSGNKPDNIPSSPEKVYKNEWEGMPDWLGYRSRVVTNYDKLLPFKEARKFARSLEFKKNSGWTTYCKSDQKPNNIPKYPDRAYKNEWLGWPDWLGYEEERWLPFKEARKFARSKKVYR